MSTGGYASLAVLRGIDASRLANLIRRLSSEFDGEILATVSAICRTLSSAGHTFHDLAEVIEAACGQRVIGAASTPADARQHPSQARWRRDVKALLRRRDELTDWELRFVRNVSRYRSPPSAKQLDVLAGIRRRLEEEAAHAA